MTLEIGSGAMEEEASSADLSCVLCRNWGNGKIRKQLGAWLWFSNSYYKSQSAGDPVEDLLREDGFNSTFMWTELESCYCLYVWYWYEFDQVLLFVDIFFTLNRLILFDTSRFIKERTYSVLIWKKSDSSFVYISMLSYLCYSLVAWLPTFDFCQSFKLYK